jgi:hypothetical protein
VICIPAERLWSVALAVLEDDRLLTLEELGHLESCHDCFDGWADCLVESGRIQEQEYAQSAPS